MAEKKTRPKSQRDLVRERALLAHEETGIYVDAEELVCFGDSRKDITQRLPLGSIEQISDVRLAPVSALASFAMALAAAMYLLTAEPGIGWSWTVSVLAWLFFSAGHQRRWRVKFRVRCAGDDHIFAGDETSFEASAFVASLQLLVRDHAAGRLAAREALRPPAEDRRSSQITTTASTELGKTPPQDSPSLRHEASKLFLLGNELVWLDEQDRFAARIPLGYVRSACAVPGYEGRWLTLPISILHFHVARSVEEHLALCLVWLVFGILFFLLTRIAPWTVPRLRVELERRVVKLPIALPWVEAKGFAASVDAAARRAAAAIPTG